jgi:hypothetical protein
MNFKSAILALYKRDKSLPLRLFFTASKLYSVWKLAKFVLADPKAKNLSPTEKVTAVIDTSANANHSLAQRWLWFFISLHVVVWTWVPNYIRTALPMDAAEGAVWGRQLEWGYDRNPWLNGWLTRLAVELGGISDIFIYFFSQLCVALAFWSIWRLARKMLTPLQAVVAVLMLEAIQYYTIAVVDFNDNVLELGLWPLLMLLFYQATTSQRYRHWLGVGLVAALALMTKYYSAILLVMMLVFLLAHPKARKSFKNVGFYLGILLFILIITPHVIWLFQHNFVTIHYALQRVNDNTQTTFWHYLRPGLNFAVMQLLAFLGAVGLFCFVLGRKPTAQVRAVRKSFDVQFLWIVGVGPYFITVLLALLAGWQLHTMWGTPLLACWGLLLVYYLNPYITPKQFYRFLIAVFVVFSAFIGAYTLVMLKPGNTSSGNFPAKTLAEEVTHIWHTHYQQPLAYVVGDRVLCSQVARYSADKPQAQLGWDIKINPWIEQSALHRHGAIFLQNVQEGDDFPVSVYQQFPNLKVEGVHYLTYVRPAPDSMRIKILVGILPKQ